MAVWTTPDAIHSKCGELGGFPATNAIDDNTSTQWIHYVTCYHWIIFDMGETKKITKIRLYQSAEQQWGGAVGLYVYVSDNPANFGAAVWNGSLYGIDWQESGSFEKNGRYVKLLSKISDQLQYMNEFDAYAAPPPVAHEVTITESLGLLDGVTKQFSAKKTITDLFGMLDTIKAPGRVELAITDSLGMVDSQVPKWDAHLTVTDKLGLLESTTTAAAFKQAVSDILGLLDTTSTKATFKQAVTDVLGMLDSATRGFPLKVTISEILAMRDRLVTRKKRWPLGDLPDDTIQGGA